MILFQHLPKIPIMMQNCWKLPIVVLIQVHHINLNLIPNGQHFARMLYPVPGQFTDVDQTIGPTQVHKGTEVTN